MNQQYVHFKQTNKSKRTKSDKFQEFYNKKLREKKDRAANARGGNLKGKLDPEQMERIAKTDLPVDNSTEIKINEGSGFGSENQVRFGLKYDFVEDCLLFCLFCLHMLKKFSLGIMKGKNEIYFIVTHFF